MKSKSDDFFGCINPEYRKPRDRGLIVISWDNRRKYDKYKRDFERTFGVSLSNYLHHIFGFDLIRFDEEVIKTPNGISMLDYITSKYGKETASMIQDLIK